MSEIRAELSKHPVTTRVLLTGPMVVARDIAHAKLKERVDKTPVGYASGSFDPTTAGRIGQLRRPLPIARRLDGDDRQG